MKQFRIRSGLLAALACLLGVLAMTGAALAGPLAYAGTGSNGSVAIIDTATNAKIGQIATSEAPETLIVTPDRSKLYAAGHNGNIFVVDTTTNIITKTIPIGNAIAGMAVSPDGAKIYVSNYSFPGRVSVVSTATNTVTATIPVGEFANGIALSPDGTKAYVTSATANTVSVVNTATNAVTATIPVVGGNLWGVAVSRDGSKVYVTKPGTGSIAVINASTNSVTGSITPGGSIYGLALSPDGARAYAASYDGNSVSVISTATNTVTATIPVSNPYGLAVTPDGSKLYVQQSNAVVVIATATNSVVTTIAGAGAGDAHITGFGITVAPSAPPSATLLASTSPQSRSTTVGTTVTAFANMLNASAVAKTNCRPQLGTSNTAPAAFHYQTTNASNQATGTPDTPVTLPPNNGVQNFVFSLTPSAAFSGLVGLTFICDDDAAFLSSVNEFTLNASVAVPPDIIPVNVTPSGDGVIRIAASGGVQAMATAAVNIGTAAQITVTPSVLGGAGVPITLTVAETDANGVAIQAQAASLLVNFAQNVPHYFSVFATGVPSMGVPFQPDLLRVQLKFTDANNVLRGQTSAAIVAPPPNNAGNVFTGWADSTVRDSIGTVNPGTSISTPTGYVFFQALSFNYTGRLIYYVGVGVSDINSRSGGPVNTAFVATTTKGFNYSDIPQFFPSVHTANGREQGSSVTAGLYTPGVGGTAASTSVDENGVVRGSSTSSFSASTLNLINSSIADLAGSWTVQNARAEAADQVNVGTMSFSSTGQITGSITGAGIGTCELISGQVTAVPGALNYMNIGSFQIGGLGSCQLQVLNAEGAFIFKQPPNYNPFAPNANNTPGTYYEIVYWDTNANRAGILFLKR